MSKTETGRTMFTGPAVSLSKISAQVNPTANYRLVPQTSQHEAIDQFVGQIREFGLTPPSRFEPGKFVRFPGEGKSRGNSAGWLILFRDLRAGAFGDFSTGLDEVWTLNGSQSLDPGELQRLRALRAEAERQHQAEVAERQREASTRASELWTAAGPAPIAHPYLSKKRINPGIARISDGKLLLPVTDIRGQIQSLQFIDRSGGKCFLRGGRIKGGFVPIRFSLKGQRTLIICEGWATGQTLAELYPASDVLAALNCKNLEDVALALRFKWPDIDLIIAGDDDRSNPENPGKRAAEAAAWLVDARVIFPDFPPDAPLTLTDFNDVVCYQAGGLSDE